MVTSLAFICMNSTKPEVERIYGCCLCNPFSIFTSTNTKPRGRKVTQKRQFFQRRGRVHPQDTQKPNQDGSLNGSEPLLQNARALPRRSHTFSASELHPARLEAASGGQTSAQMSLQAGLSLLSGLTSSRSSKSHSSKLHKDLVGPIALRVYCITWNMMGKAVSAGLDSLLGCPQSPLESNAFHDCNLIAIGTQECEQPFEHTMLFGSSKRWEAVLVDHLSANYELVHSETMAAMQLAIFVKRENAKQVSRVAFGKIATGIGNMMGNKGAVAVSLVYGTSTILFINSHFAGITSL